jgi:SAM-dependent methyltransferase
MVAGAAGWEAGCLLCAALGLMHRRPWRRAVVALGLPLALLVTGLALPPWVWLLLLAALLLLYPWQHWRDAPLFLTPPGAFDALPAFLPLPPGARVLDAGCGSGAALRAWHRAYPKAEVHGVEASLPLALWARLRCPFATVRRGDLWAEDWSRYTVVYLFQRPESMPQAAQKAGREMAAGSWLVSLDFPLPERTPSWEQPVGRHRLLVYAMN